MANPREDNRSAERIRDHIRQRLAMHSDFDASDVHIVVGSGAVTLSGTVANQEEKRLAEYVAEDVLGERNVDNQLKVRHGFWATMSGEAR
jgi:osmotically-inducible protein OsmY